MLEFKRGLLVVFTCILLANGFSYFFIPNKTFIKESVVSINLSSKERMPVKSMVKYKNTTQPIFSDTQILEANQDNWIHIPIDSTLEIENIAIYWGNKKVNQLLYKSAQFSDGNNKNVQNLSPFVLYNSDSAYVDTSNPYTTILSKKNNGKNWSMLSLTADVNRMRAIQKNKFLSFWTNIYLVLFISIVFLAKKKSIFSSLIAFKRVSLSNPLVPILSAWLIVYPYNPKIATPFLILSCLVAFYRNWGKVMLKEYITKNFIIIIYFLFWLLTLLTLNEPEKELKSVIAYLPLLFIPFPFLFLRKSELRIISKTFIASVVIYLLLFTLTFFSRPISKELSLLVSFRSFFSNLWHPAYFALLVLIGLVILKDQIKWLLIYSIASSFLFLIIDSRSGIVAVVMTFVLISINKIHKKPLRRIMYFVFFTIFCIATYILANNLYNSNNEARPNLWKAAFEIAKSNPIIGVGAYNVTEEIKESKTIKESLKTRGFNTHNQFFEILASKGLIGLILFLLYIVYPIYRLPENSYFYFIVIVFVMFFFESFLSRQAGMSTFAFWHAFFYKFSDMET